MFEPLGRWKKSLTKKGNLPSAHSPFVLLLCPLVRAERNMYHGLVSGGIDLWFKTSCLSTIHEQSCFSPFNNQIHFKSKPHLIWFFIPSRRLLDAAAPRIMGLTIVLGTALEKLTFSTFSGIGC